MPFDDNPPEADREVRLPEQILRDLKRLYTPPSLVPPEVDRAIGEIAWRHCDAVRARRRIRWWGRVGLTAGAILALVLFYDLWHESKVVPAALPPLAGPADINRDGQVDILDAFALARLLERDQPIDPSADFNHDGVVDHADLETLVARVVAVLPVASPAQHPPTQPAKPPLAESRAVLEVYVDSGDIPLAAYQVELTVMGKSSQIAGVEGGDHPAFAPPPYHDPAAIGRDRIVIAAFSAFRGLPTATTPLARINLRTPGGPPPPCVAKLIVAASTDGAKITAKAMCTNRSSQ